MMYLECVFSIFTTLFIKNHKYIYVNGGLFANEDIEILPFTDEIKDLLPNKASANFNKLYSLP